MQDNNQSQKDNSPIISAAMPEENGRKNNIERLRTKPHNHGSSKAPLIIGIVAGVVIVAVAGVLIAMGIINNQGEQISEYEYSIQRDPETGERPLFGTDPNKDNSGEAYVKYLQRIINAKDSTDAERFDAYISMAVYYNAVEEYDKAIAAMSTLTANALSDSQLERYYSVYSSIYESKGDTEKAEEYRKLANGELSGETSEAPTEAVEQIETIEE